MPRRENGKIVFTFAAPNKRAEAIGEVTALYDGQIEADIKPMTTADEAEQLAASVFKPMETKGAGGYNNNIEPIKERYRGLGEQGTASLVQLRVPVGAKFDFLAFHAEVDSLLGPEGANPKVV